MDGSCRRTCVDSLPLEVLKRIFDFLPIEEKKLVRLVSQAWRFTLDEFGWPESVSFRPKLRGTNRNVVIKRFLNSYRTMDEVKVQECNIRMSKLAYKDRRFPDIQGTVELGLSNSQATVVNFLKYGCKYANALILRAGAFQKTYRYVISGLLRQNKVGFDYLTKLEVEAFTLIHDRKSSHLKACSTLLKHIRIPKLREFKFELLVRGYGRGFRRSWLLCKRTLANFIGFLTNHASTLRILSYGIVPSFGQTLQMDWTSIPQDMKLESCEISTYNWRHLERMILPKLITGCGLKTIKITYGWMWMHEDADPASAATFQQLVAANSTTMEEIYLTICHFDPSILRPCTHLKSLCLKAGLNGNQVQRTVNDPYHFPRLTHVDLEIMYQTASPFVLGYGALLTSCGPSIRHLKLHLMCGIEDDNDDVLDVNGWVWLNACINLEYLQLQYFRSDLTTNTAARFLRLKKLDVSDGIWWDPKDPHHVLFANWISTSMPNLKIIKVCSHINLQSLKILLAMRECEEVHFSAHGAALRKILRYCNAKARKNAYEFEQSHDFFNQNPCKVRRVY